MRRKLDRTSKKILKILTDIGGPLETKEVEEQIPTETRVKILYRLQNLRGEGQIKGKQIGSGKGTWIWWVITK